MEVELEYEEEVECPNCKHKFMTSGIASGDVEFEPSYNEGYC